jgi:hypothetical protein
VQPDPCRLVQPGWLSGGLATAAWLTPRTLLLPRSNLSNLAGLDNLTTVGGGLSIAANPQLTSLAGLSSLSMARASCSHTAMLAAPAMSGHQSNAALLLWSPGELDTCQREWGCCCAQVGDDLAVRGDPHLISLAPLSALRTVGGGLYLEDLPALTSLGALPGGLQGVGGAGRLWGEGPASAGDPGPLALALAPRLCLWDRPRPGLTLALAAPPGLTLALERPMRLPPLAAGLVVVRRTGQLPAHDLGQLSARASQVGAAFRLPGTAFRDCQGPPGRVTAGPEQRAALSLIALTHCLLLRLSCPADINAGHGGVAARCAGWGAIPRCERGQGGGGQP